MFNALLRKETKIQRKGGEKEMKRILSKTLIILVTVFALTSFLGYQEAMAFDVWKTVTNIINSAYDYLGRLISQGQSVTSNGVDLDGNQYTSTERVDYELKNGQALVLKRTITTLSTSSAETLPTGDIDAAKNSLKNPGKPYSYSRQVIDYVNNANGYLVSASGSEYVEGQASPTDTGEKGGTYSGTLALTFALIDAEAVVSKREGTISYKNSAGQERFSQNINTTNSYDIKAGKVVLVDSKTTQTDTYPEFYTYTDKDNQQVVTTTKLFRSQYVHTHYDYNADGSLSSVSGTGSGWGLLNTDTGYMVYTSNITVTYEVKNGVARQTNFTEPAYYVPAENAPSQIDPEVTGKIIGTFIIHSNEVQTGTNKGTYNQYTYLAVQAADGKVYLLRALTKVGSSKAGTNDVGTRTAADGTANPVIAYGNGVNINTLALGNTLKFTGVTLSGSNGDQTANRIWRLTVIGTP